MSRIIREAKPSDMADILTIMDAAKKIMRQSGNMHQWSDGYPSEVVITNSKICKMDTTQMPVPVIVVAKALYSHNLREMGKLAELLTSLYAEEGGRI